VLPAQLQFTAAYTRSTQTIAQNSAQLADYLHVSPQMWSARILPQLQTTSSSGQQLYPGTMLLLLASLGIGLAWRSEQRRWALFCLIGAGVAFLLSLGLNFEIASWRPYEALRTLYPGFQQLRSPFRLGVFVQVFLLILAGFGLARIWRWRMPIGQWLAIGLCSLSVLETMVIPVRLRAFPQQSFERPWIQWLTIQPAGAVAMVPFPASGSVGAYESTTIAMLQALEHRKPLANGYSGLFPPSYSQLRAAMQGFPDDQSLRLLRDAGVSYVVVDRTWVTPAHLRRLRDREADLQQAFTDEDALVYWLIASSAP
jgi:hypothetical protein